MATEHYASLTPQQLEAAFVATFKRNAGDLRQTVVNAPFQPPLNVHTALLFLGIVILVRVNKKTNMLDWVAMSNTELANNTITVSSKAFSDIKVPLTHTKNTVVQAIRTQEPQGTADWKFLFEPALTAAQAHINQAGGGIAYSAVYPLKSGDGGALIYSYFQYQSKIGEPQKQFMHDYTALVDEQLSKA